MLTVEFAEECVFLTNDIGRLVIIGGAEDKEGDCIILREVVRLAGGNQARLLVLTAATLEPQRVGALYRQVFAGLGAAEVGVLDINERLQAEDPMLVRLVENCSGVFFTGGDQLRITSLIGGTALFHALVDSYRRGVVIAGTSAGASVMSSTMIVDGSGDKELAAGAVRLAAGLNLISDVVIDQHFAQRGRLGRLLAAVAQNPYVLGIGIDENTAMVVDGPEFEVIGSGTVSILDGQHIAFTNVSEVSPQAALALAEVRLHVLSEGYTFNLQTRQPKSHAGTTNSRNAKGGS